MPMLSFNIWERLFPKAVLIMKRRFVVKRYVYTSVINWIALAASCNVERQAAYFVLSCPALPTRGWERVANHV